MAGSPEKGGFLSDPETVRKKGLVLMGFGAIGMLVPVLATAGLAVFLTGTGLTIYGHSKMKK